MRKGISTSIIKSNPKLLKFLPDAELYELGFFTMEDLEKVLRFFAGKKFGVHAPFVYRYAKRHPNPTSLNEKDRIDTFLVNKKCADLSKKIGSEYMVVHFPNALQQENWLYIYEEVEREFFELSKMIEIRVENVYGNDYFHSAKDYKIFLGNTHCTMCVDIGHLILDAEMYGFSPARFIDVLSDSISEFHIYYADFETYRKCHHAPWGDSRIFHEILEFIRGMDADFVIESTPECPDGLEMLLEYWRGLG
ncbi:sugar phosphate isomerase/epimerase [Thermotoga sp. KOL6]|uniref:sugar phosphate isomerase/epimerase family protein n=1 Tax=Thermotoga sp. KOL6 TaxID=126741 RepID=UPI000C7843C4|nr:sugar phosphate isomerase/epimerase [Thermotoga sp. KOL6]PLV59484.1 xylose isomerase [Thermotoga sp. KOL6]